MELQTIHELHFEDQRSHAVSPLLRKYHFQVLGPQYGFNANVLILEQEEDPSILQVLGRGPIEKHSSVKVILPMLSWHLSLVGDDSEIVTHTSEPRLPMNCGKEMQEELDTKETEERPVAQRRTKTRDAEVRFMKIAVRFVKIHKDGYLCVTQWSLKMG